MLRRPWAPWRLIGLPLLLGLVAGCRSSGPPPELTRVQSVADGLLRSNRIHTTPLRFALALGETAPYWARKAGLCHPGADESADEACQNWAHQAPSEAGSGPSRQVARLAYLFGSAQAQSFPQGVISFDRSFFLVHDDDLPALRCVVAHELVHVLHRHAFQASRLENTTLRDLPEAQRQRALARLSQQQELEADRGAMLMVARSGHAAGACLAQLQHSAELNADYAPEEPLGTHPGLSRRLAAARAYLNAGLRVDLRRPLAPEPVGSAPPGWSWDGEHQLLRVSTLRGEQPPQEPPRWWPF